MKRFQVDKESDKKHTLLLILFFCINRFNFTMVWTSRMLSIQQTIFGKAYFSIKLLEWWFDLTGLTRKINSFYSNDTSVPLIASAAVLYQRGRYKSLKHI